MVHNGVPIDCSFGDQCRHDLSVPAGSANMPNGPVPEDGFRLSCYWSSAAIVLRIASWAVRDPARGPEF